MARPGPKPKPLQLRLLHGDDKAHPERINRQQPKPRDVLPTCPPEVSPEVREIFAYLVAETAAMRSVTAADQPALVCLAEAIRVHREASKILAQTKILVKSARDEDRLIRNPLLSVQRDAANTIRLFCGEFGLTPASRSGIRLPGPNYEPDDLLG